MHILVICSYIFKCGGAEFRCDSKLGAEKNVVWIAQASVPRYAASGVHTQMIANYSAEDIS